MSLIRRLRKHRDRNRAFRKKNRGVQIEPLEPRILLSSDALSFSATAGVAIDPTLRIDDSAQELKMIDNTNQSVMHSQALEEKRTVFITAADPDEELNTDAAANVTLA